MFGRWRSSNDVVADALAYMRTENATVARGSPGAPWHITRGPLMKCSAPFSTMDDAQRCRNLNVVRVVTDRVRHGGVQRHKDDGVVRIDGSDVVQARVDQEHKGPA